MYSVKQVTTGHKTEQEKVKLNQHKELLVGAWYILFNVYILVLVRLAQRMALNFFLLGTSSKHLQSPAHSNVTLKSSSSFIDSDCSSSTKKDSDGFPVSKSTPVCSEVTFPKLIHPLNICVEADQRCFNKEPHCNFQLNDVISNQAGNIDQVSTCYTSGKIFTFNKNQNFGSGSIISGQNVDNPVGSSLSSSITQDIYHSITPPELVEQINNNDKALLLDCRAFIAYNANHINGALNVSCTDRITKKRLADGKIGIGDVISGQEGKDLYKRLEAEAEIILYDEVTTELHLSPPNNSLKFVAECLKKRGKQTRFLAGGIQAFQQEYSSMCSQPDTSNVIPLLFSPTSPEINTDIDSAVASQILPHVYVGNQRDASDREKLSELGITHILNVTNHLPLTFDSDSLIRYKRIPATDSGSQNLKMYFSEAIEFIDDAERLNGRVLVHCQAGVSRSPTIVIAYLMARYQKSLSDAFQLIKDRRNIISPNLNFMGQLLEFESVVLQKSGLHPPSEPLHLLRI